MPPILKTGTPIVVDLDALNLREPCKIIDLTQVRKPPKDAIVIDDPDPLAVLIASTRRRARRG
jgi:hypothetical protein